MREFLKSGKGMLEVEGAQVTVKEGKTKFQEQRDWALGKASELLTKEATGRKVEAKWGKERVVLVDTEVAFRQDKEETGGSFVSAFSHLSLPA